LTYRRQQRLWLIVLTYLVCVCPPGGGKPPVELDLSGKGSNITRLSCSNKFLDITASASLSLSRGSLP